MGSKLASDRKLLDRSVTDWLMLTKYDLWLCETIVLMLVGAVYYVQCLIFNLIFGLKVVLIHMFSDADNVNQQN